MTEQKLIAQRMFTPLLLCFLLVSFSTLQLASTHEQDTHREPNTKPFVPSRKSRTQAETSEPHHHPRDDNQTGKIKTSTWRREEAWYNHSLSHRSHWFMAKKLHSNPLPPTEEQEHRLLTADSPTDTYWVESGANGDGTSEHTPAGNITYVLNHYDLTNDIIKVKPGFYGKTVERFPLHLNHPNVTLESTGATSDTVINGTGYACVEVNAGSTTISGFTVQNTKIGIHVCDTNNNTIKGNKIKNSNWYGILLERSTNNRLHGNELEGCGVFLHYSMEVFTTQEIARSNTVNGKPVYYYKNMNMENATVPSDAGQVILGNVSHFRIEGVNVVGGTVGIEIGFSSQIYVVNNTCANNTFGMYLTESNNNTIRKNIIKHNEEGVDLGWQNTQDNVISGNIIKRNREGIYLYTADNNTLRGNTIKNCGCGVYLDAADNNLIEKNIIEDSNISICLSGMCFSPTSNNLVRGNHLYNNTEGIVLLNAINNRFYENRMISCGIFILLPDKEVFTTQEIARSNTVNGKPVYYYKNMNMENATVPSDAGQVILGNVSHFRIEGVNVVGGTVGIEIGFSSQIHVVNNTCANNTFGMYLTESNNNTIKYNKIVKNGEGAKLLSLRNTTLTRNYIRGNGNGISIEYSQANIIKGNVFTGNQNGILLEDSITQRNMVYGNNFVENMENAIDDSGGNYFNNTSIGNYWDDYNGSDNDGDGIGDSPYNISGDGKSKDWLPSMEPFNITDPVSLSVTILKPEEGEVINSHNVSMKWKGRDDVIIDHYEIQLDELGWIDVKKNTSYIFTRLKDGEHTVQVKVINWTGNSAIDSVVFKVNTGGSKMGISDLFSTVLTGIGVGIAVVIVVAFYFLKVRKS